MVAAAAPASWSSAAGWPGCSAALAAGRRAAPTSRCSKRRPRLGGATWSFERHGLVVRQRPARLPALLHRVPRLPRADRRHRPRPPAGPPRRARSSRPAAAPRTAPPRAACPRRCTWRGAWPRYRHLPARRAAARSGAAALALRRLDLDDPALDARHASAQWLAEHGQSAGAIERLWDLICSPTLNLPADEASLALAAKVFQTGLLTERRRRRHRLGPGAARRSCTPSRPRARARARRGRRCAPARRVDGHPSRAAAAARGAGRGRHASPPTPSSLAVPHDAAAAASSPGGRRRRRACGLSSARRPIVNVHLVLRPPGDRADWWPVRRHAGAVRVRPHRDVRAASRASASRCRCRPPTSGWPAARAELVAHGRRRRSRALFPAAARAERRRRHRHPGARRPRSGRRPARAAPAPGAATARRRASSSPGRGPTPGGRPRWRAPCAAASPPRRVRSWRRPIADARDCPWRCWRDRPRRPPVPRPGARRSSTPALARGGDPPAPRAAPHRPSTTSAGSTPTATPTPAAAARASRPALARAVGRGRRRAAEAAVPGAVAVELVHNFSLLHDDIIDGDRERRHRPTVWAAVRRRRRRSSSVTRC